MAELTEAECLTQIQKYEARIDALLVDSATRLDPLAMNHKVGNKSANAGTAMDYLMKMLDYWRKTLSYVRSSAGGEKILRPDYEVTPFGEDKSQYIGDDDVPWEDDCQ